MDFNFGTTDFEVVNWYLKRDFDCKPTLEGKNLMFTPGEKQKRFIYLPPIVQFVQGPVIDRNVGNQEIPSGPYYTEADLRRELIRSHGAKLKFLFEGVDKKTLEFKVERHWPIRFVGTAKGAYVDSTDWALDALREWAGVERKDNFAKISREWARNGEGKLDVPKSLWINDRLVILILS